MTKLDRNLLLATAYLANPDWSFAKLGEIFSITGQSARRIVFNYERAHNRILTPDRKWKHHRKGEVNAK